MKNKHYKIKYYRLVSSSTTVAVKLSTVLSTGAGTFFDRVLIQALPANTGNVAVGDAPVAAVGSESGFVLQAGQNISLDYVDIDEIKLIPLNASDGIMVGLYVVQTT